VRTEQNTVWVSKPSNPLLTKTPGFAISVVDAEAVTRT